MKLYPFQEAAVQHLMSRRNACLADDQGLGKTISAAVAAKRLGARNVRVIAPSVALWNWQRELSKWAGIDATVCDSTAAAIDVWSDDSMVTSHSLVLSDDVRIKLGGADVLIVDESQFFMQKSTDQESARCKALYRGAARQAERVWVMSGTPAPNGFACEYYSMLHALMPHEFKESYEAFRARYCMLRPTRYGDGFTPFRNQNVHELKQRMGGFLLRRLKKDVLPDLPPRRSELVSVRPTKMPPELAALEAKLRRRVGWKTGEDKAAAIDAHAQVASAETPQEAFEAMGSHDELARFRRISGVAKTEPAAELVNSEFDNGLDCIVIAAQHTEVIETLAQRLSKHNPVVVNGAVTAKRRDKAVRDFQNGKANVFIGQIQAAGTAITLTRASEALFAELSFVPGENMQFADRIYRIGQTRPVRSRFLSLAHSVDEIMTEVVRNKVASMEELLA